MVLAPALAACAWGAVLGCAPRVRGALEAARRATEMQRCCRRAQLERGRGRVQPAHLQPCVRAHAQRTGGLECRCRVCAAGNRWHAGMSAAGWPAVMPASCSVGVHGHMAGWRLAWGRQDAGVHSCGAQASWWHCRVHAQCAAVGLGAAVGLWLPLPGGKKRCTVEGPRSCRSCVLLRCGMHAGLVRLTQAGADLCAGLDLRGCCCCIHCSGVLWCPGHLPLFATAAHSCARFGPNARAVASARFVCSCALYVLAPACWW